jgi:hypothetical protein
MSSLVTDGVTPKKGIETIMITSSISTASYALSTLEDTPRRALELLRGIGSSPTILRIMTKAGYTPAAHEEGQRLLGKVVSFVQEKQAFVTVRRWTPCARADLVVRAAHGKAQCGVVG